MKYFIKSCALVVLFSGFMVNAAEVPHTKLTQSCKPLIDKNLKVPQPPIKGLPPRVAKKLQRGQEHMAEERYDEAMQVFKELITTSDSNYVKSVVNRNLAYAVAQKGDQEKSLPYFQKALDLGEGQLPHDVLQSLRENVAGLLYSIDEKHKALKMMQDWMKRSNKDSPNAYYLLAAMYADSDIGNFQKAICPAYFATTTERKPKQSYFQLLLALHYEMKDYDGSATILKSMVEYFPKENKFYRQLSTVYMELERVDDALAIMEMLYVRKGFDKGTDYQFFSNLFGYKDIPFRAAEVLREGIEKGAVKAEATNWKTVAQYYQLSNEIDKAINAYQETAKISKDGKPYVTLGELYSDKEQWSNSIKAFDQAFKKGDLEDDEGRAYLRKGIAQLNLGQCDSALSTFNTASKYKDYKDHSKQWRGMVSQRRDRNKCK